MNDGDDGDDRPADSPSGGVDGTERTPAVSPSGIGLVAPTHDDPFVAGGSEAFGGPLGTHARSGWSWWTPLRVLIAMTLVSCVLGYLQKMPCRDQPWDGGFQYSHTCYNDIYPLYFGEGLADGKIPYLDRHGTGNENVEYPVLIGVAMELGSLATKLLYTKNKQGQGFFDITWLMLTLAAVITVIATALTHRRRMWDAAMVATAPALILAGFINWDLLAVAITALSMLAWSRKRVLLAGLLLGAAVATKFYPIFLFAPLFFLCLRGRQLRAFFVTLVGALLAWIVIDVPVWLASPSGFLRFYVFNRDRDPDWGSLWYAWAQATGHTYGKGQVNIFEAGLIALAVLGIGALILAARRRPRLPQVFFLTLAATLVVNKVYSPQYVLWLLPLAVLARPRWRAFIVWQAAEIIYFLGIWMYLLDVTRPGKGLEFIPYAVALCIRDAAVLGMCVLVIIDILRPDRDVVRADGSDDPAGGVLDEAPDIFAREERIYDAPVPAPV